MIGAAIRELVRRRAGFACEYCRLPESAVDVPFHVEHVRARQHDGTDGADNLALACDRCNLHKGPNLSAFDPETNEPVPLFHPRGDRWQEHFQFAGFTVVGLTPAGRATAALLRMNDPHRVRLRSTLGNPPP